MFNNNEKATKRALTASLFLFLGMILGTPNVQGQIANIPEPSAQAVVVLGEIEHVFVDDMDDMWSAGWIVADGTAVRIPSGLLIDLPMNRLTLRDIMAGASPECLALGESGLASSDECLRNKGLQGGGAQSFIHIISLLYLLKNYDIFLLLLNLPKKKKYLVKNNLQLF